MSDAKSVVEAFFAAIETKSIDDCAAALGEHVTDDFVWQNSGFPTMNSRTEAQGFLLGFAQAMPMTGVRVEVIAIAAAGGQVVTERIDHFIDADGAILASLPLAGVLEVNAEGKLTAWRDYFDPRPLLGG